MSGVGTEEPIPVDANGDLLYLLTLSSRVLHYKIQVIGEPSPKSCFVIEQLMRSDFDSPPHCRSV